MSCGAADHDGPETAFLVELGRSTRFDFYAMDCYRQLAEDKMAGHLADEVIQASTDFDGTERAPIRTAEARLTLGVIAARQGDIEQAVHFGERARFRSKPRDL